MIHTPPTQPHATPNRRPGFTLVELMAALIIFALVATAGAALIASTANTQNYVQNDVASSSEISFAMQRIIENIRSANALSTSANTLTITSPPSSLINNATFTITYTLTIGGNLTETYVNNSTGYTYSSGTLIHNLTQFSIAPLAANAKAFQITLSAGSSVPVSRTFVAFGRNL